MYTFSFSDFDELSNTQVYQICKLRQDVFILEQTCLYADLDDKDSLALHFSIEQDGKIIAYARFFPLGNFHTDYSSIGRFLVSSSHRNQKLAHKLMEYILQIVDQAYKAPIKISAQTYLLDFYSEYGFVLIGDEYVEDGIPHCDMIRK